MCMSKLQNLLRSKFIAGIIILVYGILKSKYPELPWESIYGLLFYIGGESIKDALAVFGKKPENAKPGATSGYGTPLSSVP